MSSEIPRMCVLCSSRVAMCVPLNSLSPLCPTESHRSGHQSHRGRQGQELWGGSETVPACCGVFPTRHQVCVREIDSHSLIHTRTHSNTHLHTHTNSYRLTFTHTHPFTLINIHTHYYTLTYAPPSTSLSAVCLFYSPIQTGLVPLIDYFSWDETHTPTCKNM